MEAKLKKLVEKFLAELQVVASDIKIVKDENDYYHIDIATDETGLLIGFHGETIRALELMIKLAAYKAEGKQVKILLNIGDYREKKEERLHFLADRMVERLKEQAGEPVTFPYLAPYERRVIHLYFQDNPEFETVSEGEGPTRRLILRMRQK